MRPGEKIPVDGVITEAIAAHGAIDVLVNNAGIGAIGSFEDTDAFRWLTSRAVEFGFSMTYPRDNPWSIAYEPWHWSMKG